MSLYLCNFSPTFNESYHHNRDFILVNRPTTVKIIDAEYESNLVIVVCKRHYCHCSDDFIKALDVLFLLSLVSSRRLNQTVELAVSLAKLLLSVVFKLRKIAKYEIPICLVKPEQFAKLIFIDE